MDSTPIAGQDTSDSGCISGTFESSHSFYESTPKEVRHDTPNAFGFLRKRKASDRDIQVRKLTDVIESCPSTPQFSSTLNEPHNFKDVSLVTNGLEDFHIYNSNKYFKDLNGRPKIPSEPCTPEKKDTKTPSSFSKYIESPRLEAQQLLYPNLKEVKSSPNLKLGRDILLNSSAKKALFLTSTFYNIVRTPVIMENIFQYLSNGDLYRFGMVSKCCLKAIESNKLTNERYLAYKEIYKVNKENYRITPPNSPEKNDTFSNNTEASNENFNYFLNMGQTLNEQQQLQKCRKCGKACIVEHNIGQCEKCGFTYCLICDSVANSPENFHDKCQNSKLLTKSRNQLSDLSNSNLNDVIENSSFSLLNSSSRSSGFYSDCDTPKIVKKNLSSSLRACGGKPKVLSNSNRIVCKKTVTQRRSSIVPVVVTENEKQKNEIMEPSSPPKVKNYAICSKQSKRNLKRLTR